MTEPINFIGQGVTRLGIRCLENAQSVIIAENRLPERPRNKGFCDEHPHLTQ